MKTPAHDYQARAGVAEELEQLELFERCEFTATFPNPETNAGIALAYLLKGARLRQSQWLDVSWRLAAEIRELKRLGWPVISSRAKAYGRRRKIAEYWLPRWLRQQQEGA